MPLEYLAVHEAEIERIMSEFACKSSFQALNTYVPYLYTTLEQRPSQIHDACGVSYASLSIDDISKDIFDFHGHVIDFYRHLSNEAPIPEAKERLLSHC